MFAAWPRMQGESYPDRKAQWWTWSVDDIALPPWWVYPDEYIVSLALPQVCQWLIPTSLVNRTTPPT